MRPPRSCSRVILHLSCHLLVLGLGAKRQGNSDRFSTHCGCLRDFSGSALRTQKVLGRLRRSRQAPQLRMKAARSEFGWQIAVDLKADADLNEDGGSRPSHSSDCGWQLDYAPAERCKVHCATSVGAAGTPPSTARSISGLGLSPLISRLHPPRSDPDAAWDVSTPRDTFAVVDPLPVGGLAAQPLFTGPGRLWFLG
jgi:hypothetical protein